MLEQLDFDPADILFVGDTWTCDVEGPRVAGMRPVYLRRPHFGVDRTRPEAADETGVTHADDLTALRALLPSRPRLSRPSHCRVIHLSGGQFDNQMGGLCTRVRWGGTR